MCNPEAKHGKSLSCINVQKTSSSHDKTAVAAVVSAMANMDTWKCAVKSQ